MQNQFGQDLLLNADTPFELASISKTFTATLYAATLRTLSTSYTVGDFIVPNGPLQISDTLAAITLDELVNYTSGLPQDDDTAVSDTPPYLPQPYSNIGMLSYPDADPPPVTDTGGAYTYSNLAFALTAAICGPEGSFSQLMKDLIFQPVGISPKFFGEASLKTLPLGYYYDYREKTVFSPAAPGWPLFPAYNGAGGVVASGREMMRWLQFNMGVEKIS